MKFFVLQNPKTDEGSAVTDFVPVDGSRLGEAPRCPICGQFVGMLPLLPPVRIELEAWGADFGDIAFGPADEILVTERFWELYQASGLTGLLDVGPAEVVKAKFHGKARQSTPQYRCCRVAQGRAAINDAKSGLEKAGVQACEECRQGGIIKRTKRVVLEPDSWSDEDIFFARGLPGIILVSEKFQQLCEKSQVSNCWLAPAEEFSFDHYPWENDNAGATNKR
jgi:hypothetical protein